MHLHWASVMKRPTIRALVKITCKIYFIHNNFCRLKETLIQFFPNSLICKNEMSGLDFSWSLNSFTALRNFEAILKYWNTRTIPGPWNLESICTYSCPLKLYLIPPSGTVLNNIFCLDAKTGKTEVHFQEGQWQKKGTAEEWKKIHSGGRKFLIWVLSSFPSTFT